MSRSGEKRPLSRLETLGAWLHVWTPPRGVDVPSVPWNRILILVLFLVPLVGLAAVVGLPAIQESNEGRTRAEAQRDAERLRERRRAIQEEQTPQTARGRPARAIELRPALLAELETEIGADARGRIRAGEGSGTVKRTDCVATARSRAGGVAPEDDPARTKGGYDCTAVTSDIVGSAPGSLGYPFKAVVDFASGKLTWCRTNPPPGERSIPDPDRTVQVPDACRDPTGR